MTKLGNRWTHATLAAMLAFSGAAIAQQATNSDPYSGVSQPPPDATITASPDAQQAAPPAKPSPDVPAAAPASPAPEPAPPAAAPPASTPAPAAAATNPDFDIVSTVPGQPAAAPSAGGTTLQTRPGADDGIVSAVPSSANDLAEGTNIRVKLSEKLSTNETAAGSPFKGEVVKDVYKGGSIIIPAGSVLKGRVISVSQGHHLGPSATLRLRPDVVMLPDGTAYHLYGQVAGSEAPGMKTDSEGGIQPKPHTVKTVVAYGAAAGTGAVVGAYAGGPVGAAVGSLVGAGIVTAHILMQHPSAAVVPAGSIVTFSLTEAMALTPTNN